MGLYPYSRPMGSSSTSPGLPKGTGGEERSDERPGDDEPMMGDWTVQGFRLQGGQKQRAVLTGKTDTNRPCFWNPWTSPLQMKALRAGP